MAALPPYRQIQFNQIPGAPPWFAAFLMSLNQFLGAVYDMANGNTTFGDNIPRQLKTVSYAIPASGYAKQTFACTLKTKPVAVLLGQAVLTQGTAGTAAISLNQWSYQAGSISLDSIVGLAPNATYTLTFLVY